eukprot:Gb_32901 [translate_table: standard]
MTPLFGASNEFLQLMRRNEELALLYEKIKIQQSTLNKGMVQYRTRLNEIRMLKIKLTDLKREHSILKGYAYPTMISPSVQGEDLICGFIEDGLGSTISCSIGLLRVYGSFPGDASEEAM